MTVEGYLSVTSMFAGVIPILALVVSLSVVSTTFIVKVAIRLLKRTTAWADKVELRLAEVRLREVKAE